MFGLEDRTCTNLRIGTSRSREGEGGWVKTSPIYQNTDLHGITRERLGSSFPIPTSLKHCALIGSCHQGGQSNKIPTVKLNWYSPLPIESCPYTSLNWMITAVPMGCALQCCITALVHKILQCVGKKLNATEDISISLSYAHQTYPMMAEV